MPKFLLSIFLLLQLPVLTTGQEQGLSVVETPTEATPIDSRVPGPFQETDSRAAIPTLIRSQNSVAPFTQSQAPSLLGNQLNRITPNPADHSPFVTARSNCNQFIPASQISYLTPASRLPLVGAPIFPGYTTPRMNQGVSSYRPPVVYNNLPAYRPPYGFDHCSNPFRAQRLQRSGLFMRRFGR